MFADKLQTLQDRERSERIILLWLYVNPHGTYTRTTNSVMKQVLRVLIDEASEATRTKYKHEIFHILTSILNRLTRDSFVDLFYYEDQLVKIRLTGKGRQSIEQGLSPSDLQQLRQMGGAL